MRRILAFVIGFAGSVSAEAVHGEPPDVSGAIDRGLAFLAKDAIAWKDEHNCVSCHHAALVAWSLREAKQRSHAVDEDVLADMTKWMAESGDGRTGVARPAAAPRALNTKAVWFALALGSDREPDDASRQARKRLLETVKGDQTEDGSWSAWPETRPPIFGSSDQNMTALATLALQAAAEAGDDSARAARDKGVTWLAEAKPDDELQSIAIRLVLWRRAGRPVEESNALIRAIEERQDSDGGWAQRKDLASDAWATGQALYALALAGMDTKHPAIARGQAFLVKTQRADGSWPMASRPTRPGGEGSKSLIPITGAGSAWAVLGLVRSR